jgi:hypothetical protein
VHFCNNIIVFVLCAAGRADIQSGQQVLQSKLDLLLQRQQAAIDAMNAANSQLAALQVRSWHLWWCGAVTAAAGCRNASYVLQQAYLGTVTMALPEPALVI